jgi:hypothetical protein
MLQGLRGISYKVPDIEKAKTAKGDGRKRKFMCQGDLENFVKSEI